MTAHFKFLTKTLTLTFLMAFMVGHSAEAKNCKKGKACGNACIAQDAVCSKDAPATAKTGVPAAAVPTLNQETKAAPQAAPQAPATAATAKAAAGSTVKQCTKGKPCGDACIAKDAVCNK